jgi:hypothetical protein
MNIVGRIYGGDPTHTAPENAHGGYQIHHSSSNGKDGQIPVTPACQSRSDKQTGQKNETI